MNLKLLSLVLNIVLRYAQGGDPINDPYDAAIVAAEATGLNDRVKGHSRVGAQWLVATSMASVRLEDVRGPTDRTYPHNGVHIIDARFGRQRYESAVDKGQLDPATCPYHFDEGQAPKGVRPYSKWSTRGPFDASIHDKFEYLEEYVGTSCFPPSWFDVPLVAAISAAEHAIEMCDKYTWQRCDVKFLRCIWGGIGRCVRDPQYKEDLHKRFRKWLRLTRRMMAANGDLYEKPTQLSLPPRKPDEQN